MQPNEGLRVMIIMYQITESLSLNKMCRKWKKTFCMVCMYCDFYVLKMENLSLQPLTTVQISVQVIFLIISKIINVLRNGKLFTLFGIEESLTNYEVKVWKPLKNY